MVYSPRDEATSGILSERAPPFYKLSVKLLNLDHQNSSYGANSNQILIYLILLSFRSLLIPFLSLQALEKIEYLEEQLTKEHQLRKTTDDFILDLQTSRQAAVSHVNRVRGGQRHTSKHFKAVQ